MSQRALEGLGCIIVGGTSGIGWATTLRFLHQGARILIAGLPAHAGALERRQLTANTQIRETTVDASSPESVAALLQSALDHLGSRLDVLVHAAGISGRSFGDGPLHECTDQGWEQVLAVNARGAFLTNRAAIRLMLQQEPDANRLRGAIVNIGSVVDRAPSPSHFDTVAYAASKGALRALTLASAARYAALGIRFNLVEPGLVDTPMAARALSSAELAHFRRTKQPLTQGAVLAEDVADAAVYLASPAARAVTGATITVDGAWCLSDGQEQPT